MKRILTYLFLCVFLYGAVGYYAVFLVRQDGVRREMKAKIKDAVPQSEMFVFSFSEKEYSGLNWKRVNKEFQLGGALYDIVRKNSDANGNITIYCINDIQESQLFAGLEKQVQKNSSGASDVQKVFNILFNSFFTERTEANFFSEKLKISYPDEQTSLCSFTGKISSPPPEMV